MKCKKSIQTPFKNIPMICNAYALYVGEIFEKTYTLNSVIFYKYGGIMINFLVNNSADPYEVICEKIKKKAMDYYFKTICRDICISDFIISSNYDKYDYSVDICNITASMIINGGTLSMLNDIIRTLAHNPLLKLNYKTKSSVEIMMMIDDGMYFEHIMQVLQTNKGIGSKELLTSQEITKVHAGITGTKNNTCISIGLKNVSSIENLEFHLKYIIAHMFHFDKKYTFSNVVHGYSIQSPKELSEFAKKHPKTNLKQLQQEDTEMFGKRTDPRTGAKKAYSNMCQKPEQRPVVINKETYEKYHAEEKYMRSVLAMDNQTYLNKKLYLMCPDEKFNTVNFHSIPNQKCIIRCTTKNSNNSQFIYCGNMFNVESMKVTNNEFENRMIIKYNPLLSGGRKCMLPPELNEYYSDYILISFYVLNTEQIETKILNEYGMKPFIMERNEIDSTYRILTTDVNFKEDNILILKSSIKPDIHFLCTNLLNTKEYFNVKNHPEFIEMINKNNLKSEAFMIFFEFIRTVIPQLQTFDMANKFSIEEYFKDLHDNYNVTFIISKNQIDHDIVGLLINDFEVYLTPKYDYGNSLYIDSTSKPVNFNQTIDRIKSGMYSLPDYDVIVNGEYPLNIMYKDERSQKIVMINVKGYDIFIKPIDIPEHVFNVDIITIDFTAVLTNIRSYKPQNMIKKLIVNKKAKQNEVIKVNNSEETKFVDYYNMIIYYIFLCYIEDKPITIDNVILMAKKYNTYTEGKIDDENVTLRPYVKKIPASSKTSPIVSWTHSKVNRDIIEKYFSFYKSSNVMIYIKLITQMLKNEYNLKCEENEQIVNKVITSII